MKYLLAAGISVFLNACGGSGADTAAAPHTPRTDTSFSSVHANNARLPVDRSPMDIAYFPPDYPVLKTSGKAAGAPLARVIYSRPHRQGRAVFGALVPHGQPWRLGANEATELELFAPATIQKKTVAPGRYILYCIPDSTEWTIVFNSNLHTWGLHPDSTKDVGRFSIPVIKTTHTTEHFTMVFVTAPQGTELVIAWEGSEARLPIQFK
jgi:hypothetical protein